jgi:hypothetical protein
MAVFVIIIVIKKEKRRKYAFCPCLPLVRSLSHTTHTLQLQVTSQLYPSNYLTCRQLVRYLSMSTVILSKTRRNLMGLLVLMH